MIKVSDTCTLDHHRQFRGTSVSSPPVVSSSVGREFAKCEPSIAPPDPRDLSFMTANGIASIGSHHHQSRSQTAVEIPAAVTAVESYRKLLPGVLDAGALLQVNIEEARASSYLIDTLAGKLDQSSVSSQVGRDVFGCVPFRVRSLIFRKRDCDQLESK